MNRLRNHCIPNCHSFGSSKARGSTVTGDGEAGFDDAKGRAIVELIKLRRSASLPNNIGIATQEYDNDGHNNCPFFLDVPMAGPGC
mmetsp:Transcript_7515/g.11184  ORF Transcript_7515/g.11184 Transcript_7515/m.11184 type:complete len:86 (+) Transcript_7515:1155-1412(+)